MHKSSPLVIFSAWLLMLAASTGALAQGDPAALQQHPVGAIAHGDVAGAFALSPDEAVVVISAEGWVVPCIGTAAMQHAGVERIRLWDMVEVQDNTMAEEMTCSKDDGKHCIMAKDAHGDEVEVLVSEVKAGGKLTCTEQRDFMRCQKAPRKPQQEAMKQ
jgi:hypothetical protein